MEVKEQEPLSTASKQDKQKMEKTAKLDAQKTKLADAKQKDSVIPSAYSSYA